MSEEMMRREKSGEKLYFHLNDEELDSTIPQRFAKVVQRYPHNTAVTDSSQSISYAELNRLSNRIAHAILNRQLPNDRPLALLLPNSAEAIATLLGALKSGKVCLPINPDFPTAKIKEIFNDNGVDSVIANWATINLANEIVKDTGLEIINIDHLNSQYPASSVTCQTSPDSLALIMLTSGTTGEPKGVMYDHKYLLHRAFCQGKTYRLNLNDRHTLLFPYESGAGFGDIATPLVYGAALYLFNPRQSNRVDLINWLAQSKITIFHAPITLYRQLIEAITGDEDLSALRLIILGGQALRPVDIMNFRSRFSQPPQLAHQYALNVAGLAATCFINSRTIVEDRVPSGYASYHKQILIFNEDAVEVSESEVGEIAIKSRYLGLGYWRNLELTQQSFLVDPENPKVRIFLTGDLGRIREDGMLEVHGRKDFQTKVSGFTVQPDAIEAVLREWESIKDATIVTGPDSLGENRLIAYIVFAGGYQIPIDHIRKHLGEKLPEYMIPGTFVSLDMLPLNVNGKVDTSALPPPDRRRPNLSTAYAPPRTPLEKTLVKIWTEVLNLEIIGIHDEFLDLGGNSLLATRITSRIDEEVNAFIPPSTLFSSETISTLALAILTHQSEELPDDVLNQILKELEELSEDEADQSGSSGYFS